MFLKLESQIIKLNKDNNDLWGKLISFGINGVEGAIGN